MFSKCSYGVCLLSFIFVGCNASLRVQAPMPPQVSVEVDTPGQPTPPPPPPTPTVTITANAPELLQGVVTITPNCTPGVPERLNGLDDNCNGQVDEGFVQSGAVQITLGWNTGADLDLYVTDPFGEVLSYQNNRSSSGGQLDRDARGACTDGQTTENVFWPAGEAPRGNYRIEVHYFNNCQAAGPTLIVLSIMVGGQPLGVYQHTLHSGQRLNLASFTIP